MKRLKQNLTFCAFWGEGCTIPLCHSCYHHRVPVVGIAKFLLEKGADANRLDDYAQSPLFAALATKHGEIANILLDHKADPNIANKYKETALHRAAETGDEKMVRSWWGGGSLAARNKQRCVANRLVHLRNAS